MTARAPLPERVRAPAVAVRMLSDHEAARYAGVSTTKFRALVAAGTMPAPVRYPGLARVLWDVRALDRAIDAMSEVEEPLRDGEVVRL